jgi:hypothetical protein
MPAVKVHKSRRKKRDRKHRQHTRRAIREPVDRRQSWLGSFSLLFGLLALFLLAVQGIMWFQQTQDSSGPVIFTGILRQVIYHVTRFEIVAALIGAVLALLCFPFSSRRKRNGVVGFMLSVSVLGAWIYLQNWQYL